MALTSVIGRPRVIAFLWVGTAVVMVGAFLESAGSFYMIYIAGSLILGGVCSTTLVWMLDAWRSPDSVDRNGLAPDALATRYSFSFIVPARHEENVIEATLARLVETDHPDFEIIVVLGEDDTGTQAVVERVVAAHPERVRIVIDRNWPKNKPKALNTALPHCRGTITGVFDAEDDVHPALVRRVDQCFQKTDADVVQAGVQLMNLHSNWFAVRNVLEYYFWFRSRLHFHARAGFIPLGGNTVFVRTDLLREVGGWDAECLAEDCELGVRLSSMRAKFAVFYEPEVVTREETPPTLSAFLRQRTRWNQGYLQTLARGYWCRLPFKQRMLGLYTLAMPCLLALGWILIPAAIITAIAIKAPVPATLLSFLPAVPMLTVLAVEVTALGEFCSTFGEKATLRDYTRLVVGLPLYHALLAFAAARAVAREARGSRGWEKTAHFGLHVAGSSSHDEPARAAVSAGTRAPGLVGAERSATELSAPAPPLPDVRAGTPSPDANASEIRAGARAKPSETNVRVAERRSRVGRIVARRRNAAIPAMLVAVVGVVQAANMLHWPVPFFDEGTYVSNAWAVQTHGALSNYTYGYGHPPVAWLILSLWTWTRQLFGHAIYSIDAGRELMFAVAALSSWLMYVLALRLGLRRPWAAAAVILYGVCPTALYFHRLVLLDNFAVAWMLASLVLALSPRRRLWTFAASGACLAGAALSKETSLIFVPIVLLAAASNFDARTRRYCLTLLGCFFGLISIAYPLYATLKGELVPGKGHVSLIGEMYTQLVTRRSSGSLFDPNSGAHGVIQAWLHLDPWLLIGALALCPIAFTRRRLRFVVVAYVGQVVLLLRPGYLPFMYVIGLLPFAAIVVASSGEILWNFTIDTAPRHVEAAGRRWRGIAGRARQLMSPVVTRPMVPLVVVAVLLAGTQWVRSDRSAVTSKPDAAERAAGQWILHNIDHSQHMIVDSNFWMFLVDHGFNADPVKGGFYSRTVVFNWPLDYDPAVQRVFPQGWRDFDYIVSTDGIRSNTGQTPNTAQALGHSFVVASFGTGVDRVEIREIARNAPEAALAAASTAR